MNKKQILFFGVIAVAIEVCILCGITMLFRQQYAASGYSRRLNISYDESKGLELLAENDECKVYLYGISECKVTIAKNGESVDLKDVLFDKLSIDDLTSCLDEQAGENGKIYVAENYVISVNQNEYVIARYEWEF